MASSLLELDIEGMTCTACARRVEKTLNRLDGVSAYVDFASEKAHLQLAGEIQLNDLKDAVEAAGYRVGEGKQELQTLRPRLIIGLALAALAMLFSMVPVFAFEGGHYLVWALATPVITCCFPIPLSSNKESPPWRHNNGHAGVAGIFGRIPIQHLPGAHRIHTSLLRGRGSRAICGSAR